MVRKAKNTTLDDDLFKKIQHLAIMLNKNANDLIEEGMQMVLEKYNQNKEKDSE